VEVKNFILNPGNKCSAPAWRYDLTKKKIGVQHEFSDLIIDFDIFLKNLLTFFEDMLCLCIGDELKKQNFLSLYRIPDEEIRSDCPVVYRVGKTETN